MFFIVCGPVSIASATAGIVFFYEGYRDITVIFGAISLIISILDRIFGDQNNLVTEIFSILVGAVVSAFWDVGLIRCISLMTCIGDVAIFAVGFIQILLVMVVSAFVYISETIKKNPKRFILIAILVVALIFSVAFNVYFYFQSRTSEQIDDNRITSHGSLKTENDDENTTEEITVYIVKDDGFLVTQNRYYHQRTCGMAGYKAEFEKTTEQDAIEAGYEACPFCIEPTVYINTSVKAECYHRSGCNYLRDEHEGIRLSEAKERGLSRCQICNPPE